MRASRLTLTQRHMLLDNSENKKFLLKSKLKMYETVQNSLVRENKLNS